MKVVRQSSSLKGGHLHGKHFCRTLKSSEMTNFKKEVCKNKNKLILNEFVNSFYEFLNIWNKITYSPRSCLSLGRVFCATQLVCHDEPWNTLCEFYLLCFLKTQFSLLRLGISEWQVAERNDSTGSFLKTNSEFGDS